jgi:hypothetical protein
MPVFAEETIDESTMADPPAKRVVATCYLAASGGPFARFADGLLFSERLCGPSVASVILPGADPTQPAALEQIGALRSRLVAAAPEDV